LFCSLNARHAKRSKRQLDSFLHRNLTTSGDTRHYTLHTRHSLRPIPPVRNEFTRHWCNSTITGTVGAVLMQVLVLLRRLFET